MAAQSGESLWDELWAASAFLVVTAAPLGGGGDNPGLFNSQYTEVWGVWGEGGGGNLNQLLHLTDVLLERAKL